MQARQGSGSGRRRVVSLCLAMQELRQMSRASGVGKTTGSSSGLTAFGQVCTKARTEYRGTRRVVCAHLMSTGWQLVTGLLRRLRAPTSKSPENHTEPAQDIIRSPCGTSAVRAMFGPMGPSVGSPSCVRST